MCLFLAMYFIVPFFGYSMGCFFSAGLYQNEYRRIWQWLLACLACFVFGAGLALHVCLPILCQFITEFERSGDVFQVHLEARISSYIQATFYVLILIQLTCLFPLGIFPLASSYFLDHVSFEKHASFRETRDVNGPCPDVMGVDKSKFTPLSNRHHLILPSRLKLTLMCIFLAAFLAPPDLLLQVALTLNFGCLLEVFLFSLFLKGHYEHARNV
jgi:Sec-independent protein secretion pathway component TatC